MNKYILTLLLLASCAQLLSMEQAVQNRNVAQTKRLIAEHANLNQQDQFGVSILYRATEVALRSRSIREWKQSIQVLKALLDAQADPNQKTSNGTTPLMLLAHSAKQINKMFLRYVEEAINLLIAHKAQQDLQDAWGRNALNMLPMDPAYNDIRKLFKMPEPYFAKKRNQKEKTNSKD